jgi:phosphatidylserine decarboxylase
MAGDSSAVTDKGDQGLSITRYGYNTVAVVSFFCLGSGFVAWQYVASPAIRVLLLVLLLGVLIFTANFFRDPERTTPGGDGLVISPADGKVVLVKPVHTDEFLTGEAMQVSVFMSPLNVHVNRYPITGTVRHFRYIKGEYLVAFEEKSSDRNERTHIGIENERGRVLFKQIAGFVARRIVAEVTIGEAVRAGDRFGMIRFGSRVDVLMPPDAVVKVAVGDNVSAGTTILAEMPGSRTGSAAGGKG